MKTTDTSYIEKLASRLLGNQGPYLAIDRDEYESTKKRFGPPALAIETGNCDSSDSLAGMIRSNLHDEDLSEVHAVMTFLSIPRKSGMTMEDFQLIERLFSLGITKKPRSLRSVSFTSLKRLYGATVVLWK